MNHDIEYQPSNAELGVYECEIHLKFRLIEEKEAFSDHDKLLELLIEAFACGSDEYMEPLQVEVTAREVAELEASPTMRRHLIRLRNSKDLA